MADQIWRTQIRKQCKSHENVYLRFSLIMIRDQIPKIQDGGLIVDNMMDFDL